MATRIHPDGLNGSKLLMLIHAGRDIGVRTEANSLSIARRSFPNTKLDKGTLCYSITVRADLFRNVSSVHEKRSYGIGEAIADGGCKKFPNNHKYLLRPLNRGSLSNTRLSHEGRSQHSVSYL